MTDGVSLSLLVLRTRDVGALRTFYELLGIEFVEERHGNGPRHVAGHVGRLVLEIYPLAAGAANDTILRLGFVLASLTETLRLLQGAGVSIVREARATEHGFRAVVKDPDGRFIELLQAPTSAQAGESVTRSEP